MQRRRIYPIMRSAISKPLSHPSSQNLSQLRLQTSQVLTSTNHQSTRLPLTYTGNDFYTSTTSDYRPPRVKITSTGKILSGILVTSIAYGYLKHQSDEKNEHEIETEATSFKNALDKIREKSHFNKEEIQVAFMSVSPKARWKVLSELDEHETIALINKLPFKFNVWISFVPEKERKYFIHKLGYKICLPLIKKDLSNVIKLIPDYDVRFIFSHKDISDFSIASLHEILLKASPGSRMPLLNSWDFLNINICNTDSFHLLLTTLPEESQKAYVENNIVDILRVVQIDTRLLSLLSDRDKKYVAIHFLYRENDLHSHLNFESGKFSMQDFFKNMPQNTHKNIIPTLVYWSYFKEWKPDFYEFKETINFIEPSLIKLVVKQISTENLHIIFADITAEKCEFLKSLDAESILHIMNQLNENTQDSIKKQMEFFSYSLDRQTP